MRSAFLQEAKNQKILSRASKAQHRNLATHSSQGFIPPYRAGNSAQKDYFKTATRFPTQHATIDGPSMGDEDEISANRSMPVEKMPLVDSLNRRQATNTNTLHTLHWPVFVDKDQLIDEHFPEQHSSIEDIERFKSKTPHLQPQSHVSPQRVKSPINAVGAPKQRAGGQEQMRKSHSSQLFEPGVLKAQLKSANRKRRLVSSTHRAADHIAGASRNAQQRKQSARTFNGIGVRQ